MIEQAIQTEEKDFARDITTRALINTNRGALLEHKAKKEQAARLDKIENDVQEIKMALRALLELGANK
jgi:hypothetical protein